MRCVSNSIKNIYRILGQLRLYALEQESMVDGELAAYNTAFRWIEEKMQALEARAFIQTAATEDLASYEALVGLQHLSHLSKDARRQMVIDRLSLAPYDFTVSKMSHILHTVGLEAQVTEHRDKESLTITVRDTIDPQLNMDQVSERLHSMLPAHLEWTLVYGTLRWNMLDQQLQHWNHWDRIDFTWDTFDTKGETLFI